MRVTAAEMAANAIQYKKNDIRVCIVQELFTDKFYLEGFRNEYRSHTLAQVVKDLKMVEIPYEKSFGIHPGYRMFVLPENADRF